MRGPSRRLPRASTVRSARRVAPHHAAAEHGDRAVHEHVPRRARRRRPAGVVDAGHRTADGRSSFAGPRRLEPQRGDRLGEWGLADGRDAVDVVRRQARVRDRLTGGLDREFQPRATGPAADPRDADSGNDAPVLPVIVGAGRRLASRSVPHLGTNRLDDRPGRAGRVTRPGRRAWRSSSRGSWPCPRRRTA